MAELARGNTQFAFDLYQAIRGEEGNLFYSPASISLALAMTYAGARGETDRQMAEVLRFTLPQDRLHPAFNALDQGLTGRDTPAFTLNVVNALWGQTNFQFRQEFLDLLALNYGAGMRLLDFTADPEAARQVINDWIAAQTEDKIRDLLLPDMIDDLTRLVLTNAIYFEAEWRFKFPKGNTGDRPFTLLDGSTVQVATMSLRADLNYADGEGFQAVELPYGDSGVSMIVLLPNAGTLQGFESEFSPEGLESILSSFKKNDIALLMPKFSYEARLDLAQTLSDMGMPDAFLLPDPPEGADFTGMRELRELFISAVAHKAFVAVDEEGTTAAAATAVVMGIDSVPFEVWIDRPFLFLIRDNQTGTVLFMGRVLDPRA